MSCNNLLATSASPSYVPAHKSPKPACKASHSRPHHAADRVELGGPVEHSEVNFKQMQALCKGKGHVQILGQAEDARQVLYQLEKATGMDLELTPDRHLKVMREARSDNGAARALKQLNWQTPGAVRLQACHEKQAEKPGMTNVYPGYVNRVCFNQGFRAGMAHLAGRMAQAADQGVQLPSWAASVQTLTMDFISVNGGSAAAGVPQAGSAFALTFKTEFSSGLFRPAKPCSVASKADLG